LLLLREAQVQGVAVEQARSDKSDDYLAQLMGTNTEGA